MTLPLSNDDYLDITIPNPSDKKFTTIIELSEYDEA
jgi:hypothetical protein